MGRASEQEAQQSPSGGESSVAKAEASSGSGTAALSALFARGTPPPDEVAAVIDAHPADRDAMLRALHGARGNSYVQSVVAVLQSDNAAKQTPRDDRVHTEAVKLKTEQDTAVFNHQMMSAGLRDVERDIEKAKAAGDEAKLDRLKDQKRQFEGWVAASDKKVQSTAADLALIDNPATSQAALNQMLARRNAAGTTKATTDKVVDDHLARQELGRGGLGEKLKYNTEVKEETTSTVGGAASTRNHSTNASFNYTSAALGTSSSNQVVTGGDSSTSTHSTQNLLDHKGLTRTKAHSEVETSDDGKGNAVTATAADKSTLNAGLGGASSTHEQVQQVDDFKMSSSHTENLMRGDGKVGGGVSNTSQVGTVDPKTGELRTGNTNNSSVEGHLQADRDGFGLGGSGAAGRDNIHTWDNGHPFSTPNPDREPDLSQKTKGISNTVKTGVSVAGDGHVVISVKPYAGEDKSLEGRFVVVVAVHLGASLGGSADAARKYDETDGSRRDGSFGGGGDISVKGSADLSFQHVMSSDECKEYLDQLHVVNAQNAGNGKYPELAQISTAWRDGWRGGGAAAANAARAASLDNPEAIRKMADGDKIELDVAGGGEAKAHLDADAAGLGIGGHGGVSHNGTLKFILEKAHDELLVRVAVDSDTELGAGGSASVGFAKGSFDHAHKTATGTGATFHLTADEVAIKDEILRARSQADLEALMTKYPKLLEEHETSKASTDSDKVAVSVFKVNLELGGSAGTSQRLVTDKDGKQTEIDAASSQGGGSIGVDKWKLSGSQTQAVETAVSADNKASGDLAQTDAHTDLQKTLLDHDDRSRQKSLLSKATGADGLKPEESSDQSGMFLSDADYNTIIGAATDAVSWDHHFASTRNGDDWKTLRRSINAAHGDKKLVAQALATFIGKNDHDRMQMIEAVVRVPLGNGSGGSMYDFPEGLANLKPLYKALVVEDPGVTAKQLRDAGKKKEATKEAQAKIEALDSLYNQITTAQAKFTETGNITAYGEMLHHIASRRQELGNYVDDNEVVKGKKRYNDLLGVCTRYKEQENKAYEGIVDLDGHDAKAKADFENQLRGLYHVWEPDYAELSDLGATWYPGDEHIWSKLKPNETKWEQSHDHDVAPVGDDHEQIDDNREREANEHLRRPTGVAAQKAQHANELKAKDAQVAVQAGPVAAAKQKAAAAAQWHNKAIRDHEPIAPAAAQKAGAAWKAWADATYQEDRYHVSAASPYAVAAAVENNAQQAIEAFHRAEQLFKQARELNHDA